MKDADGGLAASVSNSSRLMQRCNLEFITSFANIRSLTLHLRTMLCLAAGVIFAGCARFEDRPLSAAETAEQLASRSLGDTNFKEFLEKNLDHSFEQWPLTKLDLPSLTLAAFYFHPSLDVARAQWAVARGGETTAGARPNPIVGVTPGYSANAPRGVSPWFPSVTLDVPIETAGKRRYRIAHAEHLSEAARHHISIAAWQVRSAVRAALVDHALAHRRASLLREHVELQQRVVGLLEQRFAAGTIGSAELAPARIASARLRAEALNAERQATEARGRIAECLGLPVRSIEGMDFIFDLGQTVDAALLSIDARREALQGRADVLAGLTEYAASQSALQLEIAKQYPDLHLNPGYQYDQGENKWQLGFSVELPVLYRNQGGIAEAKAKRDEAAARFVALQAKVISEIDRALLNRAAAIEQVRQLDDIARAQQQQAEQIEASLNAGAADALEVANLRLEFATTGLARLDALAKKQQATGLLEDALQRPFDALSTVEQDPKLRAAKDQ
jgi:outer membrane protein, heavy metal efflux system